MTLELQNASPPNLAEKEEALKMMAIVTLMIFS